MSNDEQSSAPPAARKPLAWFPVNVAQLVTARGYAKIAGDDAAMGALLRFMLHSWMHGPVADHELEDVCGAGARALAKAMLSECDGAWTLPHLEAARSESDAFRESRSRAGRASASKRQHESTRVDTSQHDPTRLNQDRTVQDSRTIQSDSVPTSASHSPGRQRAPVGGAAVGLFEDSKPTSKPDPKKGEHVAVVEMFQRAWARVRHGDLTVTRETDPKDIPPAVRYTPAKEDWIAAARLWKRIGGDEQLLRERMTNFFLSDAPYIRAGGLAMFVSRFDRLDHPIMALNGSAQPQE